MYIILSKAKISILFTFLYPPFAFAFAFAFAPCFFCSGVAFSFFLPLFAFLLLLALPIAFVFFVLFQMSFHISSTSFVPSGSTVIEVITPLSIIAILHIVTSRILRECVEIPWGLKIVA